jgi:hypothetical protein
MFWMADKQSSGGGIPMDTRDGRHLVPGPARRLHGGDRSGLGERGWAEDDEEPRAGRPEDTNIAPDFHQPHPTPSDTRKS